MRVSRATSARTLAAAERGSGIIVDVVSDSPNVSVEIYVNGDPTELEFSEMGRDLFDFAASVYLADECSPRLAAVDNWMRDFEYEFAVHAPEGWQKASASLSTCLEFLSGDHYAFSWTRRRNLPRVVRHRRRLRREVVKKRSFDRVCLFSGGVDSLLGAVAYLEQDERILLLGHYADNATSAAQRALASALQKRFPNKSLFVQCRIQRHRGEHRLVELPPKVEKTHRTRSFLFLAVAVAIAQSYEICRISMPENGLIALNPPLEMSRVGSLSTRTAHPLFLTGFRGAMQDLGAYSGSLENPFLFQSKTDMVVGLADWLKPLLQRSVSCARPSRYQDRRVLHCGYCVPCLYRRAAFIPAGLDRGTKEYAFDVLRNLAGLSNDLQADFRALVRFSQAVQSSSLAALTRLVLSHGSFSPEIASTLGENATSYEPWTDMLKRWARSFLETMTAGVNNQTASIVGIRKQRP